MTFDFFFFKQKTAYEMRISDWSSDVFSSDLPLLRRQHAGRGAADQQLCAQQCDAAVRVGTGEQGDRGVRAGPVSDRKSVVKGKSVSVRVGRGGRRINKKTKD